MDDYNSPENNPYQGGVPYNYPNSPQENTPQNPKKDNLKLIIGAVVAVVILFIIYFVFFGSSGRSSCGNGLCEVEENCFDCSRDCSCLPGKTCSETEKQCVDSGSVSSGTPGIICGDGTCNEKENCWDCPKDCRCNAGEYCSKESKVCTKPVCGNNICETYEDSSTCCIDCECTLLAETCNTATLKCEMPMMQISDDRAIELVITYYNVQGKQLTSIEVVGVSEYAGKIIKMVRIQVSGEEWLTNVGVTDDEEIIELPTL